MNYDEFKESIAEQIRDVLPEKYRNAEVGFQPMEKINKSYEALFVRVPGENMSVAVNLKQFYENYASGSVSFQDALSEVAEKIQREPPAAFDMDVLRNYEVAKERLFIRVCGVEQNQELLENVPHRREEDLAVTYHLLFGETEDGTVAGALITDSLLKTYGVTEEQLHQDAMENSQKLFPAKFLPMRNIMQEIFHTQMIESGVPEAMAQVMMESMMPQDEHPMYVLTNEQKVNGAGVLFYPEMMDKIGDTLGSDYIILPSSTHEVIIVPDDGSFTALEMQDMVAEVNSTEVEPEERLTDESYHYDKKDHVFEKFSTFEARMEEKKKEAEKEAALGAEVQQSGENGEDRISPKEPTHAERQEKKHASRSAKSSPAPKRESVLKKLEAKKSAAKEREAGKAKENTRNTHNRSDNALA